MDNVNFVIKSLDERKIFENCKMCKICAGVDCCKNCGCAFSPDDIYVLANDFSREERIKYLIAFIKRGNVSIDHHRLSSESGAIDKSKIVPFLSFKELSKMEIISYEKLMQGQGCLYLRTRNVNRPIIDIFHTENESVPCKLWDSKTGCRLRYNKRPKGGRLLKPKINIDDYCIHAYNELNAAIDWYPYQDIMYEVYKHFIHEQN